MKKLLCVVIMLVTLTACSQGKEKVRNFHKCAVILNENDPMEWTNMESTLTLYPNNENKVKLALEHGTDIFDIQSVTKNEKGKDGKRYDKYILMSGNSGVQTTLYVYKKRKHGVLVYLSLLKMHMYLKK